MIYDLSCSNTVVISYATTDFMEFGLFEAINSQKIKTNIGALSHVNQVSLFNHFTYFCQTMGNPRKLVYGIDIVYENISDKFEIKHSLTTVKVTSGTITKVDIFYQDEMKHRYFYLLL